MENEQQQPERKRFWTAKSIFMSLSLLIVGVAFVVYLTVIWGAFEYRQEMADRNITEEIIEIHKGVPRGWAYTLATDPAEVGSVGTLGKALAQANFSLPDLNEKLQTGVMQRSIYFYPQSMRAQVLAELEKAANDESDACKPEAYYETSAYLILTDSCSGFKGKEYEEYERKLKMELEEFWFKYR